MKKAAKIVLMLLFILSVWIYFSFVESKKELKTLNKEVDITWVKIINLNKKRNEILNNNLDILLDTTKPFKLDSLLKINYFPKKCDKKYIYQESVINNELISIFNNTKSKDKKGVFNQIDIKLVNKIINEYNTKAEKFNRKASSFPSIIISRNNHYARKNKFRIKYGVYSDLENEDKNTLEWMKRMENENGL